MEPGRGAPGRLVNALRGLGPLPDRAGDNPLVLLVELDGMGEAAADALRLFDTYIVGMAALWPLDGGCYVFARPGLRLREFQAVYVGETECFASRLPSHEKWVEATLEHGATQIHVWSMPGSTKAERLVFERELREQFWPIMNPLALWELMPQRLLTPARKRTNPFAESFRLAEETRRSRNAALARLLARPALSP